MIYFDNAATKKPFESALTAYFDISKENFGNSKSLHEFGYKSDRIVEESREGILSLLSLSNSHKCIFTSGATESNNIAIKGIAHKYSNRGKRIITSTGEHASVIETFNELKKDGFDVVFLPLNSDGSVNIDSLKNEINNDTILVSLMSVNNELGTYNNLKEIRQIISGFPKCFFHVDATQSIGKDLIDYSVADLISFSSHKIGGLKGNGCLLFKKNISFDPIVNGGGQEYGFRSGTVNVAGAYSTFIALQEEYKNIKINFDKTTVLFNRLVSNLKDISDIVINSSLTNGSPFICNFSLLKKKASVVTEALSSKGIYVSSVSACSSKKDVLSYVLLESTHDKELAGNSIRVSFCESNTIEEVDIFVEELKHTLNEVVDR